MAAILLHPVAMQPSRTSVRAGSARPTQMIVPDTGQFSRACTWSPSTGYYIITLFQATRPFRILRAPTPP